jgi:hypothetical protein
MGNQELLLTRHVSPKITMKPETMFVQYKHGLLTLLISSILFTELLFYEERSLTL